MFSLSSPPLCVCVCVLILVAFSTLGKYETTKQLCLLINMLLRMVLAYIFYVWCPFEFNNKISPIPCLYSYAMCAQISICLSMGFLITIL